ncbi:hypothetical protein HOP51_00080 [Halomonas sp. MCCC 1A11036]|uniref:Uncharacterized protein n=1 Tax=Billgrantia zhangzhouensis TaxID=2733481 RepID=A0ABS9A9E4_9GAMM|nr:hypothetical protein [Halomonas zhangzhouensis]MCE8018517.1 hypothetical protein [Halomonas zhangzhouensis]
MQREFDIESFIEQRKKTRIVGDLLHEQATDYLATLALLIRPQLVFGEYLQGAPRGSGREAQHAFKEFKSLFEATASAEPFRLIQELDVPLEILSSTPQLYPYEYDMTLAGREQPVRITSPVRWVLGFKGFELQRFRQVIRDPNRSTAELFRFVVHYLMLFYCINRAPGLGRLLLGLRFPVSFEKLADFGDMPFCVIGSLVSSRLPDEGLVLKSTEIAGNGTFEELVDEADVRNMEDAVKERLLKAIDAI